MNLERHREYIRINNEGKLLNELSNAELQVIRKETPSISVLLEAETELKQRGKIRQTIFDSIHNMTGGNVTE